MGVPVIFVGESLVDAVVEVFVVGEDDVAADIVKLEREDFQSVFRSCCSCCCFHRIVAKKAVGRGAGKGGG